MQSFTYPLVALALSNTVLASNASTNFSSAKPSEETRLVVSATRSQQSENISSAQILVIGAEEIRQMGASNLFDVLAAQPGLQMNDSIGHRGRGAVISMRGFGENAANNVLVLVNGRKLNNASLAGPDLGSIQLHNIKRIEITYGGAGSLYGDQASAGVIHIFTFDDANDAYVEAGRGSDDLELFRGAYHANYDSGVALGISLEKKHADNYRDNNAQTYRNGDVRLAYTQESFGMFAQLQQVEDYVRFPGSVSALDLTRDRRISYSPTDFGNRETRATLVGGHWQFSSYWTAHLDANQRNEDNAGFFWGPFITKVKATAIQPKLTGQVNSALGNIRLTIGADKDNTEYHTDYGFGVNQYQQSSVDYYALAFAQISTHFSLDFGARTSAYQFEHIGLASQISQDVSVFNIGARYAISKNMRLFARLDESFRWPNADENGFVNPAQPVLKPQLTTSTEVGIENDNSLVRWSVSFFHMNLMDELFYDPTSDGPFGPGTGANVNLDDSLREGLQMAMKWQIQENTWASMDYSYTQAELRSGAFEGYRVPWVAKQRANLRVHHRFSEVWSAYIDWQYTGDRYRVGDNANLGPMMGGYTLSNFALRYDHNLLYAVMRVNNITDKRYNGLAGGIAPWDYYYPAALRQVEIVIGHSF